MNRHIVDHILAAEGGEGGMVNGLCVGGWGCDLILRVVVLGQVGVREGLLCSRPLVRIHVQQLH